LSSGFKVGDHVRISQSRLEKFKDLHYLPEGIGKIDALTGFRAAWVDFDGRMIYAALSSLEHAEEKTNG
jgi:hypothetical protein